MWRERWSWAAAGFSGLVLRLLFVVLFPDTQAGDTRIYDELARNWLDHGTYGLVLDGRLTPVDIRAPGYPAFLAVVYWLAGREAWFVRVTQALLDLLTCLIVAALAARLAPRSARGRAALAGLWLAALCPFVANYAAAILSEVPATFLSTGALFVLLVAFEGNEESDLIIHNLWSVLPLWVLGAFLAGLGTLVRPETPLLLAAVGLVLAVRWRRPTDWTKLVHVVGLMSLGLFLALLPWGVRNWLTLGRAQFLAPRYAELPGEFVPRGFNAWTNTWLVRFRDVFLVSWKLEAEPIPVDTIPPEAFDSAEERARVAAVLNRYNQDTSFTMEMDREFAALARERTARHPWRTNLGIPLRRVATLWLTPRIELLPYSGQLSPPAERWEEDPVDFSVTIALASINVLLLALALAGAWVCRRSPGLALIAAFVLVRTAFLTQVETPEPRYVLVCYPALMAVAAQLWARRAHLDVATPS